MPFDVVDEIAVAVVINVFVKVPPARFGEGGGKLILNPFITGKVENGGTEHGKTFVHVCFTVCFTDDGGDFRFTFTPEAEQSVDRCAEIVCDGGEQLEVRVSCAHFPAADCLRRDAECVRGFCLRPVVTQTQFADFLTDIDLHGVISRGKLF